jgi:hypothetical protein
MFSEQIELRGHIIDSLILPKVLDEILTHNGSFTIREVRIGKQRHDPSYACIDVFGASPEVVDSIVRRLRQHGAEVVEQAPVQLAEAQADGVLHSIAVGNLLPANVKTICVDINPSVVTKLTDRGTFQAVGLVTDIEPFLRELTEFLTPGK